MTYEWKPSPNYYPGRTDNIKYIVIHHWDDPAKKPQLEGVISHLRNPKVEVAAHYVVSDKRVVQLVKEADTAWHAIQANPYTIGIEVDPNAPGSTYATVGKLVKDIRSRHGNLPLKKHSDFNETDCPGDLDLARIEREATKKEVPMYTQKQAKDWYERLVRIKKSWEQMAPDMISKDPALRKRLKTLLAKYDK